MDEYEAEQERRRIEEQFAAMTDENFEVNAWADTRETTVIAEGTDGGYHTFKFAPTVGDEE